MRIIIESPGEKTIRLIFPTRLLFNNLTALIGAGTINKYIPSSSPRISAGQLRGLIKEINRVKRKYRDFVLVDVESSDGDIVKIVL